MPATPRRDALYQNQTSTSRIPQSTQNAAVIIHIQSSSLRSRTEILPRFQILGITSSLITLLRRSSRADTKHISQSPPRARSFLRRLSGSSLLLSSLPRKLLTSQATKSKHTLLSRHPIRPSDPHDAERDTPPDACGPSGGGSNSPSRRTELPSSVRSPLSDVPEV